VHLVATYRREWLRHDLLAGVVLTALLVPQGMAYAELAGLPAVTGLYATMLPLIAYFVFGPSRILVLGPDSAVSPVVAAAIIPLAGASAGQRMEMAAMLALLVGVILALGAVLGLGFLTDLISKPVRLGYLAGIAFTVLATQLPKLLGVPVSAESFADAVRQLPASWIRSTRSRSPSASGASPPSWRPAALPRRCPACSSPWRAPPCSSACWVSPTRSPWWARCRRDCRASPCRASPPPSSGS
jgi:MFS superfamily sulfate permease-like transporter